MTPTTTLAGGSVQVECPRRPASGDTWSLSDLSGTVVGSGSVPENPEIEVTGYTAVDTDTKTLAVTGPDLTSIVVGDWLAGESASGAPWTGYVAGVLVVVGEIPEGETEPEPDTATVTIDRPVGPEPALVWSLKTRITVPAVTEYGTLALTITHGTEAWTSAVEVVRSPLSFPLTVGDLLNAFPQMVAKRSLFSSPSQWAGMCGAAAELIDQEIRVRGDRTLLLLGDSQVRPALVKALRLVLAENGAYGPGEEAYPLESQKNYRDRMIQACNALFAEAAYHTGTQDADTYEKVVLSTRRGSR